jgi:excisionase family DNA binding protein
MGEARPAPVAPIFNSVAAVAARFSISKSEVRRLIVRGELRAVRLGRTHKRVLVPEHEVWRYAAELEEQAR